MEITKEMTSDKVHFISFAIGYTLSQVENARDVDVLFKAYQCMGKPLNTPVRDVIEFIKSCERAFINY